LLNRDKKFDKAVLYFEKLSNHVLDDGKTLHESFKLSDNTSIWDILATYLILYRFPLLFNEKNSLLNRISQSYFRLAKGIIGRAKDAVMISRAINKNSNKDLLFDQAKDNLNSILFLNFKDVYYRDVLSKVRAELNLNKNISTFSLNQKINNKTSEDTDYSIWELLTKEDRVLVRNLLIENNKLKNKILTPLFIDQISRLDEIKINRKILKNELAWIIYREIPRLAPFIVLANRIINNKFPCLLITADDADQKCRAFTIQAKINNIDALVVQQGLVREDYPEWVYFSGARIACMGDYSKKIIQNQGVPNSKISLTGSVEMDSQLAKKVTAYKLFDSNFSEKKPKILFASQPYVSGAFISKKARLKCISDIYSELNKFTDLADIVIKPHPNDDVNELKKINKCSRNFKFYQKKSSIFESIEECDIFLTMFSTSALMSMCAGKPVIIANINNVVSYSEYNNSEAVWTVNSLIDFNLTLKSMITSNISESDLLRKNRERKKFISTRSYGADGKSAQRVSELALSMIKSN